MDQYDLAINYFKKLVVDGEDGGMAITKAAEEYGLDRAELNKEMCLRSKLRREKIAKEKERKKNGPPLWYQTGSMA